MNHAPLALTIPLAVVLLLLAIPSMVTATRGWAGRLERRGRLGLHTPAAQSSDEAFALANKVSAPAVAAAGTVGAVCAVLTVTLPVGVIGAIVIAVIGLVGVLGMLGAGSRLGEAAARTVPIPARKPEAGGCCGGCGCGDGGCQSAGPGESAGTGAASIPDLVADKALR